MMQKLFLFLLLAASPLVALEEPQQIWAPPSFSVQEYNHSLQQALAEQDWWAVIDYAEVISRHFPATPFAEEAPFLMGEAYLKIDQLELANQCFTTYLNHTVSPKQFEEAIQYKFSIAEQFRNGAKKPLFSSHKMPKIVSAKEDAVQIYDEVITSLPHHEIAVQALLGKAKIQAELEDYRPSLETLDLLIRRFPKHDLAAESYLEKAKVYLMQCQQQSPDPYLLDLAEVNLRKFELAFPREPRLSEAGKAFGEMKTIFANHLFEMGCFFQKTKKIPASVIYYKKVISKYPETEVAEHARERLQQLEAANKL